MSAMKRNLRRPLTTAFIFGAIAALVILIIALFLPHPSPFQYTVMRIMLALAMAGIAAEIPGILRIHIERFVTASGALAVFVVVYFYSPANLVVHKPEVHYHRHGGNSRPPQPARGGAAQVSQISITNDTSYKAHNDFREPSNMVTTTSVRSFDLSNPEPVITASGQVADSITLSATEVSPSSPTDASDESLVQSPLANPPASTATSSDTNSLPSANDQSAWRAQNAAALKLLSQENYVEAKDTLEKLLIAATAGGLDELEILTCRLNLAFALFALQKYEDAEKEHRSVLAGRSRVLGPEHTNTLASMHYVAAALAAQRKYRLAEVEFRAVIRVRDRIEGSKAPTTLSSKHELATVIYRQGDKEAAKQLHQDVLESRIRVLGLKSTDTLRSRMSLAAVLDGLGQSAEAEEQLQKVLAVRLELFPADDRETLRVREYLGNALFAQNKKAEAEEQYHIEYKSLLRTVGSRELDTLISRERLAEILFYQDKLKEAETEYRGLLQNRELLQPTEHPDILRGMFKLARCLKAQSRFAEALALATKAMEGARKTLGPEHADTRSYEQLVEEVSGK